MTKVFPNAAATSSETSSTGGGGGGGEATVLTVWRKSLLFNGDGFAVFDAKGNLVFRVDNYMSGTRGEILLMDAVGKPVVTIRRKKLSLLDEWLVYDGEEVTNPKFAVKKNVNLLHSKLLAHVIPRTTAADGPPVYEIKGSYLKRCCIVHDGRQRRMAEIKRKDGVGGVEFGEDVFRLVVQPEFDTAVAMAIVILLDRMFGPGGRRRR